MQQIWQQQIPISQQMGIGIDSYNDGLLQTRAALDVNLNLHGSMFAGSIYSLAALTGWGLVYLKLQEQGLRGDIVLAQGHIDYRQPLRRRPGARADKRDMTGELSPLGEGCKARLQLKVDIIDDHQSVAEFSGSYVILPNQADN